MWNEKFELLDGSNPVLKYVFQHTKNIAVIYEINYEKLHYCIGTLKKAFSFLRHILNGWLIHE